MTQEERHLREVVWIVIVPSSNGIEFLIEITVDEFVTPIIVRFLPKVLWHVGAIEVEGHILKLLIINNRFIFTHI